MERLQWADALTKAYEFIVLMNLRQTKNIDERLILLVYAVQWQLLKAARQ